MGKGRGVEGDRIIRTYNHEIIQVSMYVAFVDLNLNILSFLVCFSYRY